MQQDQCFKKKRPIFPRLNISIYFRCLRNGVQSEGQDDRLNRCLEKDAVHVDRGWSSYGHFEGDQSAEATRKVRSSQHCQVR